jgi:ABC-2 type transport system permease protein
MERQRRTVSGPVESTWGVAGADGTTREQPLVPGRPVRRERIAPASWKPLRPIEGPSAFGGGRRRFFSLLWLTSLQQYRLQYRMSLLGQLWAILRPLTLFGVLYFVFTQVLRFGGTIEEYALMVLLGIMLYMFFQDATGTALGALVRNEPMVRKMHFPRIVIPLSVVVSSGMTGAVNLLVTLGFVLAFGQGVLWTWLLVPVAFLALGVLTTGVALLLSTLFVRIRDIGQIWAVIARALFYASPILYPLERVPAQFQEAVALNPLAPILTQARIWVLHPDAPSVVDTIGWPALLASATIGIGICVAGLWLFVRQAPRAAELL